MYFYFEYLLVLQALLQVGGALRVALPHQDINPLANLQTSKASTALDPDIFLKVNATTLQRTGQWVSVSWSGVPFPGYDDYIALYPAHAKGGVTETAPIKFKLAYNAPTHLLLGSGTTTFRLVNMRHDLRFALLRGGLEYPSVAAWSQPITVANPNHPEQGHLSLTGHPGEVAAQWVTRDKGRPQVKWGAASGQLESVADGRSVTYTRAEMCGPPANATGWLDPGWMHLAPITKLVPGQRYFYVYGDEEFGWSEERSFLAPPAPGTAGGTVRLLAVADLGQAEVDRSLEVSQMGASLRTTARLAAEAASGRYQLLVHNGDISYARGYSSQWDVYWDQLGPAVQAMPYVTTVGNHERDWPGTGDRFKQQYDSGGECGLAYYRRTQMPTIEEDRPWFSFDFGPIHFLQYSTEHAFDPGSPQYAFIAADLAAANRTLTPWIILGGHRPIYVDSTLWPMAEKDDGDQVVSHALRVSLEPLLLKHRVDVTWHGHHHSYQRTCAVGAQSRCMNPARDGSQRAPVHIVMGHAGAGLTPNLKLRRPAIFRQVQLRHGYMRVEANATHLRHEVLSSDDGSVMDDLVLVKPQERGERSTKWLRREEGTGRAAAAVSC